MLNKDTGQRMLAYVVTVGDIYPIAGADNIELASVNGWRVIVKKNEFEPGCKAIFFEIDSLCPNNDERFAFLEKKHYKIKTMKLSKFNVISQGLIMPLSMFPELGDLEVGTDVTETLGITYYVPEDNKRKSNNSGDKYRAMSQRHKNLFKKKPFRWLMRREWGRKLLFIFFGKKKDKPKSFPTGFPYVHKTDEERVENMPYILENKNPFVVTEKLDGTSCTYILERKKFGKFEFYVSSRNVRQLNPEQECYHESNIYWELAKKYDIENKLKEVLIERPELRYICIQGEGVGSVQGNPLKLEENDLYVFNFITSDIGRWPSTLGKEFIEPLGFKWVPILDENYTLPDDLEEFKLYADGKSVVNPNVLREGLVLRDKEGKISFKNISREYLLKKK